MAMAPRLARCGRRPVYGCVITLLIWVVHLLTPGISAQAQSTLCAEVKIEVRQELTLERQAFDAHMRINNGLTHISLDNVAVQVNFSDEAGNTVVATGNPNDTSALFYIRVDTMDNITDVSGAGSVAPSTSADIHWLIIPAVGAANANSDGTLYFVGATLSYTIGGESNRTEVTPDYIHVKPMPEMELDYFITREVYGDDPFTSAVEPSEPFTLGLRVKNNGNGPARRLQIDSAQPRIVENRQGLLIGFVIEGSEVNGQPAAESLRVSLGDVAPAGAGVARWWMTCSLSGHFVGFSATLSHSDYLGGQLTSLIRQANTHFLVRDVLVDLPGRDTIRDFLAEQGSGLAVFETDGPDTVVTDQSSAAALTLSGQSDPQHTYALAFPATAGFAYVRLPDPHQGDQTLTQALRSDGKVIKPANAWLSKVRSGDQWEHFVNLFDVNTGGDYTLVFGAGGGHPQAPQWVFIDDAVGVEQEPLGFMVEAGDPNGDAPALTAEPLPAGAAFTDNGDGTGLFDWTPAQGQAGTYAITFTASDGVLSSAQSATVTIHPFDDRDGDGLPDAWEQQHFGALDRDGSGDADGDGLSDLEEFELATDPTSADAGPGLPEIRSPAIDTAVNTLTPTLEVISTSDPNDDPLTYEFEVFADDTLTAPVAAAYQVTGSVPVTAWTVDPAIADNQWHPWRVRACDAVGCSDWVYGAFFTNIANEAPGVFAASHPPDGSQVDTLTPELQITNSNDPDGDTLGYRFEVYTDAGLSSLVAASTAIPAGATGTTVWSVPKALSNGSSYFWRTIASDPAGAQRTCAVSHFRVDTGNHAPTIPDIISPKPGAELAGLSAVFTVANSSDPDGDSIRYTFQLDTRATFDSPGLRVSGAISAGVDTTAWQVFDLADHTRYYWRVRADDGSAYSPWVAAAVRINLSNEAPAAPVVRNCGRRSWVQTVTPALSVQVPPEPDDDRLDYRFEIYRDAQLTDLALAVQTGVPRWTVAPALADKARYHWRVRAVDEHGLEGAWSAAADFLLSTDGVNTPPTLTLTTPSEALLTNADTFEIRWRDRDPDSNAVLALYRDSDHTGGDGVPIVQGLAEDPDREADLYTWDISGLEGTYYLYAVIDDGQSTAVAYAPAGLTIDHSPPVVTATPPGGTYGEALSVTLEADEPATIYYTLDGSDPLVSGLVYDAPLTLTGDTSLTYVAMDSAGNIAAVQSQTYTFAPQQITVTVQSDQERFLSGLRVYAFTTAGAYTGRQAVTDGNGRAVFDPVGFAEGHYTFRIDYLGRQFWSDTLTLPGPFTLTVVIPEQPVSVAVTTGSGPAAGVRVYLFSAAGAYLGVYTVTDADGLARFDLPVGTAYSFRADVLGSRYWSDAVEIPAGGGSVAVVAAGGGALRLRVEKSAQTPMSGIKVYLFSAAGSYLGRSAVTDADGRALFDVPAATYRIRADYLGYQFWSDPVEVTIGTAVVLPIAHQAVAIDVPAVYRESRNPVAGLNVYLFTATGAYQGQQQVTDSAGQVRFELPEMAYKVRVDWLGRQLWSDPFTWQDTTVAVPMAEAELLVSGGGQPLEGIAVHLFNSTGGYLGLAGTTNTEGKALFSLPATGSYQFRADYQNSHFWSDTVALTADQRVAVPIATGGGDFTLTVTDDLGRPFAGLSSYVFSGSSYLGLTAVTATNGQAPFNLANGTYRLAADYLDHRFWSDTITVPEQMAASVVIAEAPVTVSVIYAGHPADAVRVHLFSSADSYLGRYQTTDASGNVGFELPVGRTYKLRADILGRQYWSTAFTVEGADANHVAIDAGGGTVTLTVQKDADHPLGGIATYLFAENGNYLGASAVTDSSGQVAYRVPAGSYEMRADLLGYRFWTGAIEVSGDRAATLPIAHQQVPVTVNGYFQGTATALSDIPVHLFTPTGSYLSQKAQSDVNGQVVFQLPAKPYRVRADYRDTSFWSDIAAATPVEVAIPLAEARVTVTGAGLPRQGVPIYVFSEGGAYLGLTRLTDAAGSAVFRLPAQTYRFRVDYQHNPYWSTPQVITADQQNPVIVSVGGGRFDFTLLQTATDPLPGPRCYVFNAHDAYLGLSGAANESGQVFFDLADGTCRIRVDHLGHRFRSPVYTIADTLSETLLIAHHTRTVTVEGHYDAPAALEGLTVYLFSENGAYLGQQQVTDASGRAGFSLPEAAYKIRADYLGHHFWSPVFNSRDVTITIGQGQARIHVTRADTDVEGARVYLFNDTGTYLGRHQDTDATGTTAFTLPEGRYTFRADHNGHQYRSPNVTVTHGIETHVAIEAD